MIPGGGEAARTGNTAIDFPDPQCAIASIIASPQCG
jgi:hypothetical protein